jgi:hypothetical protein
MTNILSNPALWKDGAGNQPPACWNGTSYIVLNQDVVLTLTGYTPVSGDIVSGNFSSVTVHSTVQLTANGTPLATVFGGPTTINPSPTPIPVTWDVPQSGSVPFALLLDAGSGCNSDTLTVTPPAIVEPVAPNEAYTINQNSPPFDVTPTITVSNLPVIPSGLAVISAPTNGTVGIIGVDMTYMPNTGYVGTDSFTYQATVGLLESNIATVTMTMVVPDCEELGRVTRTYASGYTAARCEVRRVRRFAKRCVVAEFNGAIAPDCSIVHVRWDTTSPWSLLMSNPRIQSSGRSVAIDVAFNFAGWGGIQATVRLSNGEVYSQELAFSVLDRPLYPGAIYNSANGPYTLETP